MVLEIYHVRAVPLCDGQLVVLDSGADISLVPQEMAERGYSTKRLAKTVLEDAQGGRLRTYGRRFAQIEMEGENDELIVIEDDFVVSSVRCPLINLGRLLHKGWAMRPNAMALAGVNLVAPDQGCENASVCRGFQVKQVKVVTYNVLSFTHVFFSLSL